MDMNLWIGLLIDEFENEETIRVANEAAINRVLLEDAATHPIEFVSEPSSTQSIATGSSRTAAAMIVEREVAAVSQPANVTAASVAPIGGPRSRLYISGRPPMVGPEEPIIDDGYGHPSMDDPSVIFCDGRPLQLPTPAPPPPVQVTQAQVAHAVGFQPAVITNVTTATGPAQPVNPSLPPMLNTSTPVMAGPNPNPWYSHEVPYGSLSHLHRSHDHSYSFSGPEVGFSSSTSHTQPVGWPNPGNPRPASLPLDLPPILPPFGTIDTNNINFDPRGVVGGAINQNMVGPPDFSNLFNNPNHPQNRDRHHSESIYAATLWTAPLFPPQQRPQPTTVVPPPVVNPPAPAPAPPPVQPPVLMPPPPIVSLSPTPPPLPPLPVPPPVVNPPGSSPASQAINSTIPQELPPNSLPLPIPMPEPTLPTPLLVPLTTTTPATPVLTPQPPSLLSSTSTIPAAPVIPPPPPITTHPEITIPQELIQPPVPLLPPITLNGCNPPSFQPPAISFSDRQPHAIIPPPPPPPPPLPPPPPPPPPPPTTATTTATTTMTMTNNMPPAPPILLLANGKDLVALFKPAYLPLFGIAALIFYAFSKMGFVVLAGILVWYAYQNPHGMVKK